MEEKQLGGERERRDVCFAELGDTVFQSCADV
jgi:hypothetical protein